MVRVMARDPFTQCFCVMVPKVRAFFWREIFLFIGLEVLFHLPYNMFRFVVIMDFQVRRCFFYFMRMPALMTEFPFLEIIHVRKCTTGGAPDDEVHGNEVMCAILLKIYR
jgi:hypothetical protein